MTSPSSDQPWIGVRSVGRRPPLAYQTPTTTPAAMPATSPNGRATMNRPVRRALLLFEI